MPKVCGECGMTSDWSQQRIFTLDTALRNLLAEAEATDCGEGICGHQGNCLAHAISEARKALETMPSDEPV